MFEREVLEENKEAVEQETVPVTSEPPVTEQVPTQNIQQDHIIEVNKVLVVDDNQLNVKVAERALKSLGLEVDSCLNGYDCIEKVRDIVFNSGFFNGIKNKKDIQVIVIENEEDNYE